MPTYSSCGEFALESDGKLFQFVGFPDAEYTLIGWIQQKDADDAPPRIRPAIAELIDAWNDRESRDRHHADLRRDHEMAALS